MRILFLHHFPLAESAVGRLIAAWSAALEATGHEARILLVDDQRGDEMRAADRPAPRVDRVVCRPYDPGAELHFTLPRFSTAPEASAGGAFRDLTDDQLAQYREQLRRRLDAQVEHFNPHVLHVQHVWVWGQLAVESGVPYALNAWGPELIDYDLDERYQPLAQQAASNAGRLLVPDDATRRTVEQLFELEAGRTTLVSDELRGIAGAQAASVDALSRLYQTLLDERSGYSAEGADR